MSGDSTAGGGGGGRGGGGESQRSIPTPFLTKTYQLVEDPSVDDLISWNEDGTAFVVWRPAEFARDLLPKYFKHNNFSSFIRQLNTYGFRKLVPDRWEFANDCFRRGEKELLRDIQRRKISTAAAAATNPKSITAAVAPATATQISPATSGDEQVLSSNSSPAANAVAATPTPPPRACAFMPEILEENDRLRRENSQLCQELNRLRSLCSNIYNLMSCYATNQGEDMLPQGRASELMPEMQTMAEEGCAAAGGGVGKANEEEEEETCPRILGVSIGFKRLKMGDGKGDDQMRRHGPDFKSKALDTGSSKNHDFPWLDKS